MPEDAALLTIRDLHVRFDTVDGRVEALRGVDLHVAQGERVALVGESGSGKSVTARAVLGLLPGRRTRAEGTIRFAGQDILNGRRIQALRGREITMIFQDPMAALNPVFTIRDQFRAVLRRAVLGRGDAQPGAAETRMRAALEEVAITDPERVLDSYVFQLSGGLNQRVMIAMALVNQPRLVIADEPGTALDVTVQEQTLRLMRRLGETHATAILFISHNLGVVRQFAERVCVMYAGRIVEDAPAAEIFRRPRHPYTRALIAAVPRLSGVAMPVGIPGQVPDLRRAGPGCAFAPRCGLAQPACAGPVALEATTPTHAVACLDAGARA